MADLLSHRQALAAAFKRCLPPQVQVFEFGGRFDLAALETYAKQAPCIGIALLAGEQADDRPDVYVNAQCAAYIATKRTVHGLADETGLRLASAVVSIAHGQGYLDGPAQDPDTQRPQAVAFRNLYSSQTAADGVWLGAVTWRQLVQLDVPANAGAMADFIQLCTSWDFSPVDPFAEPVARDAVQVQAAV